MADKKKRYQEYYYTNPRNPNEQVLIYQINDRKKEISYFPRSPQNKWIKEIKLEGFLKLPPGLEKKGKGILPKRAGYLLVKHLSNKLGEFDLVISNNSKTRIRKTQNKFRVTLSYPDLRFAQTALKEISNENFNNLLETANDILNKFFPRFFKTKSKASFIEYRGGRLEKILNKSKLLDNLSRKDILALANFFPDFIKYFGNTVKGQQKLVATLKNRDAVQAIFLDELVKKYEKRMAAKTQNEHSWQRFFSDNFLLFNPNYVYVFEKKNLSLVGKFPDFLPIDIYGHLDIFDIKRPNTVLMDYDKSRNNFYWSKEISKAIAQVESYISHASRYSANLTQEIKKKEKIDVNIVRPRGFVVAGSRKQLCEQSEIESFRILNDSLKNIQVLLYDDVLDNLKAFLEKMSRKKPIKKRKS
jgi:hypothetical protein